jgi:hypothetical protein
MNALNEAREKQKERETKAAIKIQRLWSKFSFILHSAERAALLDQVSTSVNIKEELHHMLAADPRCKDWAFSLKQRREMDHQKSHFAAMQIQAVMRRKSARNIVARFRQHGHEMHHEQPSHSHDIHSVFSSVHQSIRSTSNPHGFEMAGGGGGGEPHHHMESDLETEERMKQRQEAREMSILVRNAQLREAQRKQAVMKSNTAVSLALLKEKQRSRLRRRTEKLIENIDSWAAQQAREVVDLESNKLEVTEDMKEARRLNAQANTKHKKKKKIKKRAVIKSNLFGADIFFETIEDTSSAPATDDDSSSSSARSAHSYSSTFSSSNRSTTNHISPLPSVEGV